MLGELVKLFSDSGRDGVNLSTSRLSGSGESLREAGCRDQCAISEIKGDQAYVFELIDLFDDSFDNLIRKQMPDSLIASR